MTPLTPFHHQCSSLQTGLDLVKYLACLGDLGGGLVVQQALKVMALFATLAEDLAVVLALGVLPEG
jgi:hypothetical protein